jgi:hypothetical protein
MTAPTEPATGPGCRCVTLRQITDRPRVVVEHVGHRLIEHQQPIDRDQPVRRQFDPRQRTGSWDPVFPEPASSIRRASLSALLRAMLCEGQRLAGTGAISAPVAKLR